jgi:hypothetical protein
VIVVAASVFGALWGGLLARRRGGRRLDIAHHAAVHAILFAMVGMVVTIAIARMA